MALTFYDNFNKPDYPVGPEYVVSGGSFEYYNNHLKASSAGYIRPANYDPLLNSAQTATLTQPSSFPRVVTFRFRCSVDEQDTLSVEFALGSTYVRVDIKERVGGTVTTLASRQLPYTWGSTVDIQASVLGENISGWVDGYLFLTCRSLNVPSGGYNMLYLPGPYTLCDIWSWYEFDADAYAVSVDSGPDENGYYTLTLHNGGRPWTVGTPGSPAFAAASGSIISQEVTDVDTATLVWEPAATWTEEVIADTLNNYPIPFGVTTPPGGTGPAGEGGGLTTTQGETLDDLADFLTDYQAGGGHVQGVMLKLGGMSLLAGSAYSEGDGTAFGDLLDAALNTTDGLSVIANRIALVRAAQDALDGTGTYSLSSVQEALRGTSSRDLTQVYNLIAALTPADQTDVTDILNAIAAIRTGNLWTLDSVKTWIEAIPEASNQDVLNELALIRTANFWTLGHVKDWIEALTIPDYSTDLQDLADAVDAIPTNPITDLSSVLTAISNVRGSGNPDLAALLTAINARPTNPITSLEPVLTAIGLLSDSLTAKVELILDAIAALTPSAATPTAPVWPGIGNVTLGDPINLAATFAYSGPCDGVLVALTSDPNNHGVYGWGSVTQYPRAGYLSFVSDNGDYSDVQPFSFPSNLICVQGMLHADGFIGRARPGATGTVTPWTITVP